jgi:hypothetical protein
VPPPPPGTGVGLTATTTPLGLGTGVADGAGVALASDGVADAEGDVVGTVDSVGVPLDGDELVDGDPVGAGVRPMPAMSLRDGRGAPIPIVRANVASTRLRIPRATTRRAR